MRRIAALVIAALVVAPFGQASGTEQDAPRGSLELVGHSSLMNRGMNAALAIHGDHAYIGSRTDAKAENANNAGVLVVDISDPSAPEVVHQIGPPDEANPGETSREMRIWPEEELLIVMTLYSNCGEIHGCTPVGGADRFNFYDISGKNAARPKLVATYEPSENPHEFFLWDDPKRRGRALMFISTPGGGRQMLVTDISLARKGKFRELITWSPLLPEGNLHSLSVSNDGKTGYLAHLRGGFVVVDMSDFARNVARPNVRLITPPDNRVSWAGPGAHSAVKLFGRKYALVTDEVYGEALRALGGHGCPWGWTRLIDIKDPTTPKVIAEYKLEPYNDPGFCTRDAPRPSSSYSAHNPTLTKSLAFISWHSGGLQAVSIKDPAKPQQVGEFRPDPLLYVLQEDPALSLGQDKVVMWSYPIIKDGLIYVVDVRNGFFILEYKGPFSREVKKTRFLEGNSNLGDALRFEKL